MVHPAARAFLGHRAWTYAALFSSVAALSGLLYFDALVALAVDCATYKGNVSHAVEWLGTVALYLSAPLLLASLLRGILVRSLSVALSSVGLCVAGLALLAFTVNYTFAYCLLDGVKLPPCLLGCAH